MANIDCESCETLRRDVPELVVDGFDESMCNSLKNDTGLKPSLGNDDCEDFNTMNDCLIGNMEAEIDKYDSCSWKSYTRNLVKNLWTMFHGIICALCGIWTNIHNLWDTVRSFRLSKSGNQISLTSLLGNHGTVTDDDTKYDLELNGDVLSLIGSDGTQDDVTLPSGGDVDMNTKTEDGIVAKGDGHNNQVWATDNNGNPAWRSKDVIDGQAFIRYYRDLGAGDSVPYWENIDDGFTRTLDIYMDSTGANGGSQAADRDYVVIINNCTNYKGFNKLAGYVTFYSSGDTRAIADIRSHQAQHPSIDEHNSAHAFVNFSWTTSGAVLLKAGEHVKVNFYASGVEVGDAQGSDSPAVRLHQFVLTWIPVSVQAITPTN